MATTAGLRGLIARQIARRTPRSAPPLRLSARRLYILPSAAGGLFAALLIVMLLGATNYGNNLIFVLTFWLGAAALVSMHRAHRNLAGLRLVDVAVAPVHAGQRLSFHLTWSSDGRRVRRRIHIAHADGQDSVTVDIDRSTTTCLTIAAPHRGRLALPALHVESRYPLGLFRCWTRLAPDVTALVYPAAHGQPRPPADAGAASATRPSRHPGTEVFIGHRRYRPGDSPRAIDWKHSARSPHLLVRETVGSQGETNTVFDYSTLAHLGPEARLSQLALWVITAEAQGQSYRLVLPDRVLGPAHGPAHRAACLEALAVFA